MKIGRYKDIEDFLFRQLPMFQRVGPKAFKKDLKNIQQLSAQLGHPHENFKSIHIAGTNGKGSCSFFLASALHQLGYKVGLYTSPHYKDYRERIRLNGKLIPKAYVKRFVNELIENGTFEQKLKPSFFEMTVAMAFQYFSDEQVDFAIIETGLGGRLDSTNIISPELSIITNIGYDHTNFLGTTLEAIAGEKAGIIKEGVPVIIGRKQKETAAVFREKAALCKSKLSYAGGQKALAHFSDVASSFPEYQQENLQTVYTAIRKLGLKFTSQDLNKAWGKGLKTWGFVGRYQTLAKSPKIICDSAHNEMGIRQLFEQLGSEKYQQLHIVLAVVADKDLSLVFPYFPREAQYYFSQAKIPRAMPREEIKDQAVAQGLAGKAYTTIGRALAAAKRRAQRDDLILVTGSIFTVAEVV